MMYLKLVLILYSIISSTESHEDSDWWENGLFYQILVDSFKDFDGDGVGDLNGAEKNLGYVRAIGADAVILSGINFKSDQCNEPGVIDYTQIDRIYGSNDSLVKLIEKANKLGIKVIMSFDFEKMSINSGWFKLSMEKTFGYDDYFIWKTEIDNNTDKQSCIKQGENVEWKWEETRQSYYASKENEALVNICSRMVQSELLTILNLWLDLGVSGYVLKTDFALEKRCSYKLVKQISLNLLDYTNTRKSPSRILIVDTAMNYKEAMNYYDNDSHGAKIVLNRGLIADCEKLERSADFKFVIDRWLTYIPEGHPANWMSGRQDTSRVATRYGSQMIDAINYLILLLPGNALTYQGDEIGMQSIDPDLLLENAECSIGEANISKNPFQWDDSSNAGFTSGNPWIPIANNFRFCNAKLELNTNFSHVQNYIEIVELRKSQFVRGSHLSIEMIGPEVIGVLRWGNSGTILLIINAGKTPSVAQPSRIPGLPDDMTILTVSSQSIMTPGSKLKLNNLVTIAPGEAIVLMGTTRHCGGPGPVEKITSKLSDAVQKINNYFNF